MSQPCTAQHAGLRLRAVPGCPWKPFILDYSQLSSSSLWAASVISANSELASFRFDVVELLSFLV